MRKASTKDAAAQIVTVTAATLPWLPKEANVHVAACQLAYRVPKKHTSDSPEATATIVKFRADEDLSSVGHGMLMFAISRCMENAGHRSEL